MERRLRVQEQVLGRRVNAAERNAMQRQIQRQECDRHRTYRVNRTGGQINPMIRLRTKQKKKINEFKHKLLNLL